MAAPCLLLLPGVLWGQDQIRPSSIAGRLFRPVSLEQREYNVKVGPISFRLSSAVRSEFSDNINLTEHNAQSDVILSPSLTAAMYWPLTPYNALSLNASLGYHFYLAHPELNNSTSGLTISPDTELSLDIFSGAFRINLHDQPSVQQDPTGEPSLSNVPLFGRFINTAGVTLVWSVNSHLSLTGSYDHTDFIATSSQFSFANFSEDQLSANLQYILSNAVSVGTEGAASSTRYRTDDKEDATTAHAGVFVEALLSPYTRFRLAGGYQTLEFANGARTIALVNESDPNDLNDAKIRVSGKRQGAADEGTYYLNFIATNQLSRYYLHSLTIAKESQLGITSQRVDLWSVRYQANWRVNSFLALNGALVFDDGQEAGAGNTEHFQRYGASLSTSFILARRLTLSLGYDFDHKESDLSGQSYTRNLVFTEFDYQF